MEQNENNFVDDILQKPISIEKKSHHIREDICKGRAKYREGKKETAVKVYTINDESKFLLLHGVPSLQLDQEVTNLCSKYGPLVMVRPVKDYPQTEIFETVYVVKYQFLLNAVYAKKKLDDRAFMGNILHVCYAPELETFEETKEKLMERMNLVRRKEMEASYGFLTDER